MATPPSNKSPIATRLAPISRSSEIANPIRRSFTGNPFSKPSISAGSRSPNPNSPATAAPSETTPRWSSMGSFDDKENGKDSGGWKQIRVRSPAAKNFMSPTISAASKVNASPRKKILSESNEPVRTSWVSDFKPKKVSFAPLPTEDSDHHDIVGPKETSEMVSKPPNPDIGVESTVVAVECTEPVCGNSSADIVNLDPSFEISPRASPAEVASFPGFVSGQAIAPLDADPSVPPPYDPTTNYISPRPQFLHYRPNQRVEYYLSKEVGEGKRLEESFISESFSDTEETESDYSPREVEGVTSSVEVVKKDEEANEEEEEVEEKEKEIPVSEPIPIGSNNPIAESLPEEEINQASKPSFSRRSKFTALIMVLAVALFSVLVINSPQTDGLVLKDISFMNEYKQFEMTEVTESARVSLNGLAHRVQVWSASSVSFINEFISNIIGPKTVVPLQFYNLSLMEDAHGNAYSLFDQSDKEIEKMGELGNAIRSMFKAEPLEENSLQEIGEAEYGELIDQEAGLQEIGAAEYEEPIGEVEYGELIDQEAGLQEIGEVEYGELIDQEAGLQEIGAAEYEEPIDQEADLAGVGAAGYGESTEQEDELPHIESTDGNQPESGAEAMEEHVELSHTDNTNENPVEGGAEAVEEHVGQGSEQVQSFEVLITEPAVAGASEILDEVHADQQFEELAESTNMEEVVSLETNYHEDGKALQATLAVTEESIDPDYVHSEPESAANIEENVRTEVLNLLDEKADSKASMVGLLGIICLVLTLVLTAIIFMRKQVNLPATSVKPLVVKEQAGNPIVPVSTEHTYCPSEMSSFQTGPFYRSKGLKGSDEVEIKEKRARKADRRDSLVSTDSSTGSPSYGSFTTYERIPIKKGYGEEEIITPVRRSSRVMKQVTSP